MAPTQGKMSQVTAENIHSPLRIVPFCRAAGGNAATLKCRTEVFLVNLVSEQGK